MSNNVIYLLKMGPVKSFAECIGPSLRTARIAASVLHTHHCDKDVNETPAGYPPDAMQWSSAACSCSLQHGRSACLGQVSTLESDLLLVVVAVVVVVVFVLYARSPYRHHLHCHKSTAYTRKVL